jgi:membrane protein implicated in regulation of membrane protease activity
MDRRIEMNIEEIVVGKEYIVDLNHEDAYWAFSGDVDRDKHQTVEVVDFETDMDITIKMVNIDYFQVIGINCFIQAV